MKKDLEYYKNLPYKIELKRIPNDEGGGYCAMMPEFKGVALFYGDGDDEIEAINDLKSAFVSTLEGLLKENLYIPEPMQDGESKNLAITLKGSLIDEIDFYAKKLSISRSAFLEICAKNYIKTM